MFSLEQTTEKRSNILDVKIKNYGECGFCSDHDHKETLKIPWSIWSQWQYISQRMGEKEWGAVLGVKDFPGFFFGALEERFEFFAAVRYHGFGLGSQNFRSHINRAGNKHG